MPIDQYALQRLNDDLKEKRYKQVQLVDRTGRAPSTISQILSGERGLTFEIVEAAAELTGLDPAEYFTKPGSRLRGLNAAEMDLLDAARTWPVEVRDAFLRFIGGFVQGPAKEHEIRQVAERMRDMKRPQRLRVLGYTAIVKSGLDEDIRVHTPPAMPPGGSIDALVVGLPQKDVDHIRATALHARRAAQRRGK